MLSLVQNAWSPKNFQVTCVAWVCAKTETHVVPPEVRRCREAVSVNLEWWLPGHLPEAPPLPAASMVGPGSEFATLFPFPHIYLVCT